MTARRIMYRLVVYEGGEKLVQWPMGPPTGLLPRLAAMLRRAMSRNTSATASGIKSRISSPATVTSSNTTPPSPPASAREMDAMTWSELEPFSFAGFPPGVSVKVDASGVWRQDDSAAGPVQLALA